MEMLRDFSEAWGDAISEDGSMTPPVAFTASDITWFPDPDGLVAVFPAFDPDGDTCMLSLLFKMPTGDAQRRARKRLFPLKPGQMFTVTRQVDFVTGASGEGYGRFECEVAA